MQSEQIDFFINSPPANLPFRTSTLPSASTSFHQRFPSTIIYSSRITTKLICARSVSGVRLNYYLLFRSVPLLPLSHVPVPGHGHERIADLPLWVLRVHPMSGYASKEPRRPSSLLDQHALHAIYYTFYTLCSMSIDVVVVLSYFITREFLLTVSIFLQSWMLTLSYRRPSILNQSSPY